MEHSMDEPGFKLENATIAIIGLGLMGGSLALVLKGQCWQLRALDMNPKVLELARDQEIVQFTGSDPEEILANVNLVILACPLPAILDWLKKLPLFIKNSCIVLDIGSTKRSIVATMEELPENFDPIGCHPVSGKERLSLLNAERFLFQNAPFLITPLTRTSNYARDAALQICEVLEAKPVWVTAETHDHILAMTSHLPYLLSSTLSLIIPVEAAPFIGPGFRSSARLAATSSSMMLGVLQSNRDEILAALSNFQNQLIVIENALRENDTAKLKDLLDLAGSQYESLVQQNLN
jgi:prephenate dehydrogenase